MDDITEMLLSGKKPVVTDPDTLNAIRDAGMLPDQQLHELAAAVLEYDAAIESCANDPGKMASFCSAQGDDLDALYMRMRDLARVAATGDPKHWRPTPGGGPKETG